MEKRRYCSFGAISPLSTIFCHLLLAVHVKTVTRFSVRDKRLYEISEVEIIEVDCISHAHGDCLDFELRSLNYESLRYHKKSHLVVFIEINTVLQFLFSINEVNETDSLAIK